VVHTDGLCIESVADGGEYRQPDVDRESLCCNQQQAGVVISLGQAMRRHDFIATPGGNVASIFFVN
jgi:copper homeostasis protein CutC